MFKKMDPNILQAMWKRITLSILHVYQNVYVWFTWKFDRCLPLQVWNLKVSQDRTYQATLSQTTKWTRYYKYATYVFN